MHHHKPARRLLQACRTTNCRIALAFSVTRITLYTVRLGIVTADYSQLSMARHYESLSISHLTHYHWWLVEETGAGAGDNDSVPSSS